MRGSLRQLVVAVVCGSLALLGACTNDNAESVGEPASSSPTLIVEGRAPAPLLTAEEVLAATGDTAEKVTINQYGSRGSCFGEAGLIADFDEENPWVSPVAWTAESGYAYWNARGAKVELSECLYRTDNTEAQTMFDFAQDSGRHRDEDEIVFALASVGDEALVLEGQGGDVAVARIGEAIVIVTAGKSAFKLGSEAAENPGPVFTRGQLEDLLQAAVEKLTD